MQSSSEVVVTRQECKDESSDQNNSQESHPTSTTVSESSPITPQITYDSEQPPNSQVSDVSTATWSQNSATY